MIERGGVFLKRDSLTKVGSGRRLKELSSWIGQAAISFCGVRFSSEREGRAWGKGLEVGWASRWEKRNTEPGIGADDRKVSLLVVS